MFCVFVGCLPGITGYYRVSLDPVVFSGACGAPITRPGGRATLSCSPRPTISSSFFTKFLEQFLKLLFAFREFAPLFAENILDNPGRRFALNLCSFHFPPQLYFLSIIFVRGSGNFWL